MALDSNKFLTPNKISASELLKKNKKGLKKNQSKFRENLTTSKESQKRLKETSNKLATNWQQSSNKLATEPEKNGQQTGNKLATKKVDSIESGNKVDSELATEVATNWQQTSNKVATKTRFGQLTGLQRKITIFIFKECLQNASEITPPISIRHISKTLNHPIRSMKVTIQRLVKKNILSRESFKNGRDGWTQYKLQKEIYSELIILQTGNKLATNWQQSSNKVDSELDSELATSLPSSSSYLNIRTTTTQTDEKSQNLNKIIIPKELQKIGFGENQLEQLAGIPNLSIERIQVSLDHFAFDLAESQIKIKTSPLNLLMGSLRNGGYTSCKCVEEEQLALNRQLKFLEEREKERKKAEKKRKDLLYYEWITPKTPEEIKSIVPPKGEYRGLIHESELKNHFFQNEMASFEKEFFKELN